MFGVICIPRRRSSMERPSPVVLGVVVGVFGVVVGIELVGEGEEAVVVPVRSG